MSFIAVDSDCEEFIYDSIPEITDGVWDRFGLIRSVQVPQGTAKKLLGYDLTWDMGPKELV